MSSAAIRRDSALAAFAEKVAVAHNFEAESAAATVGVGDTADARRTAVVRWYQASLAALEASYLARLEEINHDQAAAELGEPSLAVKLKEVAT